jgi:hypothetical protein
MEAYNAGDLADILVARERLNEQEARVILKQLVCAVSELKK